MTTKFIPVRTIFFNKFEAIPFDVFLKLSDNKFVKILNNGDDVAKDFIDKYVAKKIFEFHLESDMYDRFKDEIFNFHSHAQESLVKGRKIRIPNNAGLNHMIEDLGISQKETRKINEMSARIITDLNDEDDNISKLLGKFTSSEERFLYDHSYLTALISCQLANQNEWGNNPNKQKLCTAAVLHELNNENKLEADLSSILKSQDMAEEVSPKDQAQRVKLANQLKEISNIPIDVISILENSLQLKQSNLSPMACCFIVSHQYVIELYKKDFNSDSNEEIFNILKKIFPEGNLHKQVLHLTKVFQKAA